MMFFLFVSSVFGASLVNAGAKLGKILETAAFNAIFLLYYITIIVRQVQKCVKSRIRQKGMSATGVGGPNGDSASLGGGKNASAPVGAGAADGALSSSLSDEP